MKLVGRIVDIGKSIGQPGVTIEVGTDGKHDATRPIRVIGLSDEQLRELSAHYGDVVELHISPYATARADGS